MNDDGVVGKLVEVANRGKKYVGGGGDRDQLSVASRFEDGQQWVGIISYGEEL